jgi:hypothetical protein
MKGGDDLMTKQYLTEQQVSVITGRAISTLRNDRYYKRGIPYIKIGRSVRYDYDATVAFMEERQVLTSNDHEL